MRQARFPAPPRSGKRQSNPGGITGASGTTGARTARDLVRYLLDSEVHTFAFSVAANAILSFIPFIVLLYTLAHSVFHSTMMVTVINDMVNYFLPSNQDFVARNLALVAWGQGAQIFSLIMILVACTGIFLPLEVALNQAWGVSQEPQLSAQSGDRLWTGDPDGGAGHGERPGECGGARRAVRDFRYTRQISSSSILFCTLLIKGTSFLLLAATTGVASIAFFFSIYWLLPNRKVPWKHVLSTSIYTGVIWLVAKYIFELLLPHMHLIDLYGPFYVSVGLLFWAYASGLILFAGAQYSVTRLGGVTVQAEGTGHPGERE